MRFTSLLAALVAVGTFAGCVESASETTTATTTAGGDDEVISADVQGSSTVFPIARSIGNAIAEENPKLSIEVAKVGSGPGIKALIKNEADIANASRKIKESEVAEAEKAGIDFTELPVALDGIAIVVDKDNDFIDAITVADLKKIWEPDSKIKKWSDLDPSYPDVELKLYAPDTQSGTFEYFTEEIIGEKGSQTTNYESATDDNTIIAGVAGDKAAMGYFGFSYYANNVDRLKALAISTTDSTDDAVAPSMESIESGEYKPLARPLFIYLNNERVKNNEAAQAYVRKIVSEDGQKIIAGEDMVSLNTDRLEESRATVKELLGD